MISLHCNCHILHNAQDYEVTNVLTTSTLCSNLNHHYFTIQSVLTDPLLYMGMTNLIHPKDQIDSRWSKLQPQQINNLIVTDNPESKLVSTIE